MLRLSLLTFALTATVASAAEFDWPGWRGPDRTGVSKEKGLLKEWPKGGPPKSWTVKGCGKGYSSIAVTGDARAWGSFEVRRLSSIMCPRKFPTSSAGSPWQ